MQSRLARRAAIIAIFSLPLGYYRALKAQGGVLTVDLNQWNTVTVKFKDNTLTLSTREIFEALR